MRPLGARGIGVFLTPQRALSAPGALEAPQRALSAHVGARPTRDQAGCSHLQADGRAPMPGGGEGPPAIVTELMPCVVTGLDRTLRIVAELGGPG